MFSGYYVIHKKKYSLFLSLNLIAQMRLRDGTQWKQIHLNDLKPSTYDIKDITNRFIVVGIFVIHSFPLR